MMYSAELIEVARESAKAEMVKGGLWFVGGAIVSAVAYMSAEPGGRYLVLWGAVGFGAYRLLRATYYWLNPEAFFRR